MNKKLLLLLIVIMCISAISQVSANEGFESADLLVPSDELSLDEVNAADDFSTPNNERQDYLTTSNVHQLDGKDNKFEDIQRTIDSANEGDIIELTGTFNSEDGTFIKINKSVSIVGTGNGAIIKYSGSSFDNNRFFNVESSNVVLNNLKIDGGRDNLAGAILWSGDDGSIVNCEFKNSVSASSLMISGNNCNVTNSTFTQNKANQNGGAIFWQGTGGLLENCSFSYNQANQNAGAVFWNGAGGIIRNCEFNNNKANGDKSHAGALLLDADNCLVVNSNFTNNNCNGYGGAISSLKENNKIAGCKFKSNHVSESSNVSEVQGGGAIFSNASYCTVDNCNFTDNDAVGLYGGAIYLYNSNTVENSYFKANNALSGNDIYGLPYSIVRFNYIVLDYGETKGDSVNGKDITQLNNTFEPTKIKSSITLVGTGISFEYGFSGNIYVGVEGGFTNKENIKVLNHNEAKIDFKNGELTVSNLEVGTYTLRVTTIPDENHTSIYHDISINVKKAQAVIKASKLTVALKKGSLWTIKLINSKTNNPISNMKVTLKVYTGKKYKRVTLTTNSKGEATYQTKKLSKGTHKVVVSTTHKSYVFKTVTSSIKVIKPKTLKFKLNRRVNDNGGSLISFIVKDKKTNKGINGVKIKFLVYTGKKYKTYTLKTKKIKKTNGAIGFATNKLSVGKHKVVIVPASIKYTGSAKTTMIIKKNAKKMPEYFRKL